MRLPQCRKQRCARCGKQEEAAGLHLLKALPYQRIGRALKRNARCQPSSDTPLFAACSRTSAQSLMLPARSSVSFDSLLILTDQQAIPTPFLVLNEPGGAVMKAGRHQEPPCRPIWQFVPVGGSVGGRERGQRAPLREPNSAPSIVVAP